MSEAKNDESEFSALLCCPFCGSPVQLTETDSDARMIYCANSKCGVYLTDSVTWDGNEWAVSEDVVIKWNRRSGNGAA